MDQTSRCTRLIMHCLQGVVSATQADIAICCTCSLSVCSWTVHVSKAGVGVHSYREPAIVCHTAAYPTVACPTYHTAIQLQSKKEIAKALRVLTKEENFPVLVHCMHGKDRTGLLIMLVMLLCSIEPQVGSLCTHLHFCSPNRLTVCFSMLRLLPCCRNPLSTCCNVCRQRC